VAVTSRCGTQSSEDVDGRRVFRLADGQGEVAKRGDRARPPWEVGEDAGSLMEAREVGFGGAAPVMQVAQTGTDRQTARAKEILTETRKTLYRLLAEDERPARRRNCPAGSIATSQGRVAHGARAGPVYTGRGSESLEMVVPSVTGGDDLPKLTIWLSTHLS
jgi:hypothetical protein